jgi:hypothetical protein
MMERVNSTLIGSAMTWGLFVMPFCLPAQVKRARAAIK